MDYKFPLLLGHIGDAEATMNRLLISLFLLPSLASAWGGTGHEIICEIALQELSADARHEVDRLESLGCGTQAK